MTEVFKLVLAVLIAFSLAFAGGIAIASPMREVKEVADVLDSQLEEFFVEKTKANHRAKSSLKKLAKMNPEEATKLVINRVRNITLFNKSLLAMRGQIIAENYMALLSEGEEPIKVLELLRDDMSSIFIQLNRRFGDEKKISKEAVQSAEVTRKRMIQLNVAPYVAILLGSIFTSESFINPTFVQAAVSVNSVIHWISRSAFRYNKQDAIEAISKVMGVHEEQLPHIIEMYEYLVVLEGTIKRLKSPGCVSELTNI